MRRSILITMLDVMVLSVLALTARERAGGGAGNIPLPAGGMSRMVEEGLRNEAAYRDQIARLEERLKESSDLSRAALERAKLAEEKAERERAESLAAMEKLRAAELAVANANSNAELAAREAELVNQRALEAKARTLELEKRELEAKSRAEDALVKMKLAEQQAADAEARAKEALEAADGRDTEVLAAKTAMMKALAERDVARDRAQELDATLARRETELAAAKSAEAAAAAQVTVALTERDRLETKAERVTEELVEARVTAATLEEQGKSNVERVAELEAEKRKALAESQKSVWVKRDAAMRRLHIAYTERRASNGELYRVDKQLAMPLVEVGGFSVVPAEFKALGLKKSFFGGGLSDRVTDVRGIAAPMVGEARPGSLRALIVPGDEPQVCLAHVTAGTEGALKPITMDALKQRRARTAMLFSASDPNAYGLVEIAPMLGRDYLTIRSLSGTKPRTGDYLLTERGEFVGVMVKSDVCHVLPAQLTSAPKPVIIPLRGNKEVFLAEFVANLNRARDLLDERNKIRGF